MTATPPTGALDPRGPRLRRLRHRRPAAAGRRPGTLRAPAPAAGPPTEWEDGRPPRFALLVGLLVTGAGVVPYLAGELGAVPATAAIASLAAFLNAAFGYRTGSELSLLLARGAARAHGGLPGLRP